MESERHKLTGTLTPVTPESFAEWKKKRMDKKAAEEQVGQPYADNQSLATSDTDQDYFRPAKPRKQQVVPCSRAATGAPRKTAKSPTPTKRTTRMTWRDFARRQRPSGKEKRRSDWQSSSDTFRQTGTPKTTQRQVRPRMRPMQRRTRTRRKTLVRRGRPRRLTAPSKLSLLEQLRRSFGRITTPTGRRGRSSFIRRPGHIRVAPLENPQVQTECECHYV